MSLPYPYFTVRRYRAVKGTRPIQRVRGCFHSGFWGFYGRIAGAPPKTEYILTVGLVWS